MNPTVPLAEATTSLSHKRVPVKQQDRRSGPFPYWGASGIVDHVDDFIFDHTSLLVSEDGENLRSRKTPIAFLARGRYWVNNHAHVLVAKPGFDLRYLYYFVSTYDFDRNGLITGSGQPKLNAANLARVPIPNIPLAEQERIAGVLSAFDDLIETNRKLVADLELTIHALFARESFDATPGEDDAVTVGDLITVNPKESKPKGEAPYIDMAALPTGGALVDSVSTRVAQGGAKFRNGDTLLARITPCLENGKTAFVSSLPEDQVAVGSTEFIVLRGHGGTAGVWPYALARSPRFRAFAIQQLSDGTSGRQRLSADAVAAYAVPTPDAEALDSFQKATAPLILAMTHLHEEALSLTRQRDELLPLLMSGRVIVRDGDEVSAALPVA